MYFSLSPSYSPKAVLEDVDVDFELCFGALTLYRIVLFTDMVFIVRKNTVLENVKIIVQMTRLLVCYWSL